MKLVKKIKEFWHNVMSGDYDHATKSMNEFLATGKFPEEAEVVKPERVEAETVEISDRQVKTENSELTKLCEEAVDVVAENKDVKVVIKK